jgi:hypothetical protein
VIKKPFHLYGLRRSSALSLTFNIESWKVVDAVGCDINKDTIEISEEKAFTIPVYIVVNGAPVFPTKYEMINTGNIIYSSTTPASLDIQFVRNDFLGERAKVKMNTIKLKDLEVFDVRGRKRTPSQNNVMGMSAQEHVNDIEKKGLLKIGVDKSTVAWHWCHLVSFSMLANDKAQAKRNLVCGTSALNGQMASIEWAVKEFIREFKRPLGLEVTATTYAGTEIAKRIRYLIFDKRGSQLSHKEYFDALTHIKSDANDHFAIYERMRNLFKS